MTDDKRTPIGSTDITIDQKLIDEGTAQLNSEIAVLEDNDSEVAAARKSYQDMLSSRREMLSALAKQAKLQAIVTK